jgi:hypothetical protein
MPISKYGGQEGNEEKEEGIAPRSGLRPRLNRKEPQAGNVPAGEGLQLTHAGSFGPWHQGESR